jgi:hypothetical protein
MRRTNKRVRLGLVGIALLAASLSAAASPADAHLSGYCGHGKDGIFNVTHYHSGSYQYGLHTHFYHHHMLNAQDHYDTRYCPSH